MIRSIQTLSTFNFALSNGVKGSNKDLDLKVQKPVLPIIEQLGTQATVVGEGANPLCTVCWAVCFAGPQAALCPAICAALCSVPFGLSH